MEQTDIESRLNAVWHNPEYAIFCQSPYYYPREILPAALLFVGMNPSESKDKSELSENSYPVNQSGNTHPFFKAYEKFALDCCAGTWSHIDLFYFRKTEQKDIGSILEKKEGAGFLYEQLLITRDRIIAAQPKLIVVANAGAAGFMGRDKRTEPNIPANQRNEWMNLDFYWSQELGAYLWNDVPVFFSSMLSGQRALDKGSYELLAWQVSNVLAMVDHKMLSIIKSLADIRKQKHFFVKDTQQYDLASQARESEKELQMKLREYRYNKTALAVTSGI